MKGIILAGGAGTRLYPLTTVISKQLLPIYNKPMIYYPLSALMLAGIRDILVIVTPTDAPLFKMLLNDGCDWGIRIQYAIQPSPGGIAQAFIIAESFIGVDSVCLILGDNFFYGHGLPELFLRASCQTTGATIFAHGVKDPHRYGVIEFDGEGQPISIEEKPFKPRSNYAITGIYFFDNGVTQIAVRLQPSIRGELEITGVIEAYRRAGQLRVEVLGRGLAWLDTGTPESLLQAANFVQALEDRQGLQICCPEEIAFRNQWIDLSVLLRIAQRLRSSPYGQYLQQLIDSEPLQS